MTPEGGDGEPPEAPDPETVAEAGRRAGKSHREIAADLFGAGRVEAGWHADGAMRTKVRRLLRRARAEAGAGPRCG